MFIKWYFFLEQIQHGEYLHFIDNSDKNYNTCGVYIYADLLNFNSENFVINNLFDIVLIDPPWKFSKTLSRGVFLIYIYLYILFNFYFLWKI